MGVPGDTVGRAAGASVKSANVEFEQGGNGGCVGMRLVQKRSRLAAACSGIRMKQ